MAQVFEMIMLICFGLSWPFNITKSVRSRTAKGKSLWFEVCIIVGYLCGLAGKFISEMSPMWRLFTFWISPWSPSTWC